MYNWKTIETAPRDGTGMTYLEPWNLCQVPLSDRKKFAALWLRIINEGRKLTPFEEVKVKMFLKEV